MFEQTNNDQCKEFTDSPFNREPFRISKVMSFKKNGREYTVGDFVRLNVNTVMRIDSLHYEPWTTEEIKQGNILPRLCCIGCLFTGPRGQDLHQNEVIQTTANEHKLASTIGDPVLVITFEEWNYLPEDKKGDVLYCRYHYKQKKMYRYVPSPKPSLGYETIAGGIFYSCPFLLWLSITNEKHVYFKNK